MGEEQCKLLCLSYFTDSAKQIGNRNQITCLLVELLCAQYIKSISEMG